MTPTKTTPKAPSGPATVSVQQLSRLLDLTPSRIRQLVEAGAIPKVGRDRYPLVGAVQGYIKFLRDEDRRAAQAASAARLADARVEETNLRIAEKMRNLVPIEDHRAVLASVIRTVRDELAKVPDRVPAYVRERARIEAERSMEVIAKAVAEAAKVNL